MKKIRIIGLLIAILFLISIITSCSWKETNEGMTAFFNKFFDFFSFKKNKDKEINTVPEEKIMECSDNDCVQNSLKNCKWARGTFLDSANKKAEIYIEKKENMIAAFGDRGNICFVRYKILDSSNKDEIGKGLECLIPNNRLELGVEKIFLINSTFCFGTMYDFLSPEIRFLNYNQDGMVIKNINATRDVIEFDINPTKKNIYLKGVEVQGLFFENCSLSLKNPIKIFKNDMQIIKMGCIKIYSEANKVFGDFSIKYYDNPDYKTLITINGTFIGIREK